MIFKKKKAYCVHWADGRNNSFFNTIIARSKRKAILELCTIYCVGKICSIEEIEFEGDTPNGKE